MDFSASTIMGIPFWAVLILSLLGSGTLGAILTSVVSHALAKSERESVKSERDAAIIKIEAEAEKIRSDSIQGISETYRGLIDELLASYERERQERLVEAKKFHGEVEGLLEEVSSLRSQIKTLEEQIDVLQQGIKTLNDQLEAEGIQPAFTPMPPAL